MKVLISVALWGRDYRKIFVDYSLASQLSSNNLPKLCEEHDVVYHIITTRKDGRWLRANSAIKELERHCTIDWDFLENHGYNPRVLPVGPEGSKYTFLSLLQNIAIAKSLEHDAMIFNYADFIWADHSLPNSVGMLTDDVDAVLGFCLPVDKAGGIRELDQYKLQSAHGGAPLDLPPRGAADIALRNMHREGRLRFWDGPAFTITPTYLLWPVDKEGVVIRAYHQTILVMRVNADDLLYRDGIPGGSLDGYFTTILAERSNTCHASNSDEVMVFSLYDTIVDSRIGGPSRSSQEEWAGYGKEASLRECLTNVVSEGQRQFALVPIEVRRSYDHPERWQSIAEETEQIVTRFHETTAFDAEEYKRTYALDGDISDMAKRWRVDTSFAIIVIVIYQQVLLKIVLAHVGPVLKRLLGARRARALRQRAEVLVYGTNPANRPTPPDTLINPFSHPAPLASSLSLVDVFRQVERTLSREGLVGVVVNFFRPVLAPLVSHRGKRWLAKLVGQKRSDSVRIAIKGHLMPGVAITPSVEISGRAAALFSEGTGIETRIPGMTSLADLDDELDVSERLLREAITATPDWPETHRALARNLWFQGLYAASLQSFLTAELCAARIKKDAGWDSAAGVILPDNCSEVIGLTGHIDAFIKNKILTGDPRPYYLLVRPDQNIANGAFLEYWSNFLEIITDTYEIERLRPLQATYGTNWNWVLPQDDGTVTHVHTGIAKIQSRWEGESRGPLLKLEKSNIELLARQKANWGMKSADWFVCLHVRSAGFYEEEIGGAQHFRNTPIEDYYETIRAVTGMGGWVVRMGDPSVPPIDLAQCGPASYRVIDYAHCSEKSEELDVALCASCRLFVSGPSGLHTMAHAFGRPVCSVNFPMYAGYPWHPGEVFIPRRYFSRKLERVVSLEEIVEGDLVYADHQFLLERAGIELIPNTPEEIAETVKEALALDTYRTDNAAIGQKVREKFHQLNREHRLGSEANIGLFFAAKYAHELNPEIGGVAGEQVESALEASAAERLLDVVIPSFNRPARLHHLLETGLNLNIPGMTFVVIDDGSTYSEEVPGLGFLTTAQVCVSFGTKRIKYLRNDNNIGVAESWGRYYRDFCTASFTMSVTDKDEFIDRGPIIRALRKLQADDTVNMVVIPLRQKDRSADDREISFSYPRMSAREYLAHYVEDNALQHCSMWGIVRVDAVRAAGVPRSLNLRKYGLDDGFGIDIDFVFRVATLGDVEFEDSAHVRRSTIEGGTEKYPLTFAYTYYQYAKRAMRELRKRGFVSADTKRSYMKWWLLLICRGMVVSYSPVHGSELEDGTSRIRRHLPMPVLLYLPLECIRHRVLPTDEMVRLYSVAAKHIFHKTAERWRREQHRVMIFVKR